MQGRLEACGAAGVAYETRQAAAAATLSLEMAFAYTDGRYFHWCADFNRGRAEFACNLGGCQQTLPMTTGLLPTEAALGEAIFN
jgi:hypothetical protein